MSEKEAMQAIVFDDFGGPEVLVARETARPEVRLHDLLVRNVSIGVNRADLSHRKGAYGRAFFGDSDIMGLEIAGTVVEVGPKVEGFSVGDRVMGIVGGGAYAEFSRIDYRMAMHVPESLGLVEAGAVAEVFVTAHEALFHLGRLQAGESVLIHAAAGGVGSAAVQLAHAAGARVFATAGGDKHVPVKGFGADEVIDYRTEDFQTAVAQKTGGKGVDVVVDFIGAPYLESNVRSLAVGGRMVVVGLLGGSEGAALPMDAVLYRHLQIIGTVMKSRTPEVKQAMTRRFAQRWLEALATGAIRPVVDSTFPLSDAAQAHRRMESGQSVGKVLLLPEPFAN
ncbi:MULTISPECIES: NAD(P)H-quinone oxidoreductase [unclassified Variovorax]|uniref:NAD(P)H-quinone oxidoreductase n=1 Tax=unclassified Variovorax TaxID=663243 RepID=UPI00076CA882|nr:MULTISPECIES: NAD(P)H-quinone oxidoreductase [unclassified Variovorax]KWT69921.1 Quinone oxidoreductase [Variovorax sp. WDL1]PNG46703.1 2-haloacrylate reductase [Variovorax sp. B2]PNG48646.1 2-haloacrylate reductase [Variovorax sp. B4]VTV14493.1 Beta-ketoacyl-acyl-carrier-protein synthase I [Variovorax sp. WDL1]